MESTLNFEPATQSQLLKLALAQAQHLLENFTTSADFTNQMKIAFGEPASFNHTAIFTQSWPQIEIRSSAEINGARGAFAQATNKIYLSQELVNAGDLTEITDVLLEEYGHYLDSQNDVDALGDEGAIFAGIVQGKQWNAGELLALKTEDDSVIVTLDEQAVKIEQQVQSDTLDFSATNIDVWKDFILPKRITGNIFDTTKIDNFPTNSNGKLNIPIPTVTPPFALLKGDWKLENFSTQLDYYVEGGNLGRLEKFKYPINIKLDYPTKLNNAKTVIINTSLDSLGSQELNGSGFALPGAGIDVTYDLSPSSGIRNISVGDPFSLAQLSLPNVELNSFSGPVKFNLVRARVGDLLNFSFPIGKFGTLDISLPDSIDIKTEQRTENSGNLPSIQGTGTAKFINLAVDIDEIVTSFFPALKPFISGELKYPPARAKEGKEAEEELKNAKSKEKEAQQKLKEAQAQEEKKVLEAEQAEENKRRAEVKVQQEQQKSDEAELQAGLAKLEVKKAEEQAQAQASPEALAKLQQARVEELKAIEQAREALRKAGQVENEFFTIQKDATLKRQEAQQAKQLVKDAIQILESANIEIEDAGKANQKERDGVQFNYDVVDLKPNGGLVFRQDMIFQPKDVKVTMSVDVGGKPEQKIEKSLGESFEFTVPSEEPGVMTVKAKYELSGQIKNEIGLAVQGAIDVSIMQAEGNIKWGPLNAKIPKFGPIKEFKPSFTTPKLGVILGSEPTSLFNGDPTLNQRKIPLIDITKIGTEDNNRDFVIEKKYYIPYNMPFSISDASTKEGDSGTQYLEFTVALRQPSSQAVSVRYNSPKGSGTLNFLPGQTTAIIKIPVIGDEIEEPNETFTVTLNNPSGVSFPETTPDGNPTITATGIIIDDDSEPAPPDGARGDTHNDPRIVSFDKQYYDFQAAGEFILVQSTTGDLNIQVRQQPVNNDPLKNVSINTAVATILGGKKVAFYKDNQTPLSIDSLPTEVPENSYLAVGNGRIYREGNRYIVVYATGDQLIANVLPQNRIDLKVFLSKEREGKVAGLLGNYNNNPQDDLIQRNGTILTPPVSIEQLYGQYADSWRITQAESLFDYKPGENTNTFTLKNYPRETVKLNDLSLADIQKAYQLIGERIAFINPNLLEGAIVDFILTDFDETIIQRVLEAESPESVLAVIIPAQAFDDFESTPINTPVTIDVLLNDTGTEGIPLSISSFETTTTAGGIVKIDDNKTPTDYTDDRLIYTPVANFTGTDTFNYTITDGKQTSSAKVTVNLSEFNLSQLNGKNGFTLTGTQAGNFSGVSVNKIGDFNGDGITDFMVGAFGADPNGQNAAGESYVVFGTTAGFPAKFDLKTLNGSNGFTITGIDPESFSGVSVSSAGDMNNDGFDDVIIGAFGATVNGQNNAGKAYILFGSNQPFSSQFNLANLNGNNGFTVAGINEFDYLGLSVSDAGDFNNDGIADIAIIAPGPLGDGVGKIYLIFGKQGSFTSSLNSTDIKDEIGLTITSNGNSPISVSSAGDINGDGISDLIIGTETSDETDNNKAGKSHIVFGSEELPDTLDLTQLDGKNGFTLTGIEGNSDILVNKAGDLNADGFDDLVISLSNGDKTARKGYVIFGSETEFSANVDLTNLSTNQGLMILTGNAGYSISSMSEAGDFNGDGIDDLIVGVSASNVEDKNQAGKSYIIFGNSVGFASVLSLSKLDGTSGMVLNGVETDDLSGTSVSSAGDVNGDNIDDVMIGSPGSLFNNAPGKTHVVFGSQSFGKNVSHNLAKTLFDPAYYLQTNPDVAAAITEGKYRSAFEHFHKAGYEERRSPSEVFATEYLTQNPDLTAAIQRGEIRSGFEHFIKVGFAENRQPQSQLSAFKNLEAFYLAQNPEVEKAVQSGEFKSGLEYLIQEGLSNNQNPFPQFTVLLDTFDEAYYLAENLDVAEAVKQRIYRYGAFEHFVRFGIYERRNPSQEFDNDAYLSANSDVAEALNQGVYKSGFEHYLKFGYWEDRSIETDFFEFDQLFLETVNSPEISSDSSENSVINGTSQADVLTGTADNNTLIGDLGNDTLTGESGNDIFVLQLNADSDTITDFDKGIDSLALPNNLTFAQLTITTEAGATLIRFNDQLLASLSGIDAGSLDSTDFIFI